MKNKGEFILIAKLILVLLSAISLVAIVGLIYTLSNDVKDDIKVKENLLYEVKSCFNDNQCSLGEKCIDGSCFIFQNGCIDQFQCSSWSECKATFSIIDLIDKNVNLTGSTSRNCLSLKRCLDDKTETVLCDYKIPVYITNRSYCHEEFYALYEKDTNKFVSLVDINEERKDKNLDVLFVINEDSSDCKYCFNGVKDYDETEVDCGGEYCDKCEVDFNYFDWLYYLVFILWVLILILIILILYFVFKNGLEENLFYPVASS